MKIGIDDYLCNHSIDEFKDLPVEEVKTLWEKIEGATSENYKNIIHEIAMLDDEIETDLLCKKLAGQIGATYTAVRKEIKKLKPKKRDEMEDTKEANRHSKQEKKELNENEQKEALSLLRSPNILERFLNAVKDLGCVGEEENKVFLYVLCTSRLLENPIGAIVKGESSAGKNFIVSSVLQFFPEEEAVICTTMTPKALYHRKNDLKNKILAIHERIGGEESDYPIRILQSEKKLIISTPVKNPDTGRFETEDIEVEGPVAYIETTTQAHVHDENETRLFSIYLDESHEQTQRIHEAQNRLYKTTKLRKEEMLRHWRNAQRLLKPLHVSIPYVDLISFPTKPLRVRRDHLRFLSMIVAFALLFQHQREIAVENGTEHVIADIEDYTLAYSLIEKILESVLKGLSPKIKELIETTEKIGNKEFTNKELLQHIKWNRQTLTKHIKDAVNLGYFEIKEQGGHGKAYRYEIIKPEETLMGLHTPEEMAYEMVKMYSNVQSQNGHSKSSETKNKCGNEQN